MKIGLPLSSLCKSTAIQHFWKIPYHVVMTVCTLFKSHAYERALFKLAPLCCLGGSQYCSAAVSQLSQGSNYSFPDLYWRQHIFSMYCGIWSVCILHRQQNKKKPGSVGALLFGKFLQCDEIFSEISCMIQNTSTQFRSLLFLTCLSNCTSDFHTTDVVFFQTC